jgi:2-oxoglutarate dehydrogenase E2 component (dihydrolipoamide succinyltransferase)
MPTDVVMPQMGESVAEGTIVRWIKHVGDHVGKDEPLFEISTDKVDAEIPAPEEGVLVEIRVQEGDTVPVHTVVAVIAGAGAERTSGAKAAASEAHRGSGGAATGSSSPPPSSSEPSPTGVRPPVPSRHPGPPGAPLRTNAPLPAVARERSSDDLTLPRLRRLSSPVVRNIAREHNLDLTQVQGSGAGGRVTRRDILSFLEQGTHTSALDSPRGVETPATEGAPPPRAAAGSGDNVRIEKMSVMRRKIADHMVASVRTSPHVYSAYEVDFTRIDALRAAHKAAFEQQGARLTYTAFIAKATALTLREFPLANASLDASHNIIYKGDINLGVAVALDQGLIVPVIRKADEQSLLALCRAIQDLAERARAKQLKVEEVEGGTFTVTNPGIFGGLWGLPILSQPQVAILAVGSIDKRAVVVDDEIAVRRMCYLTLGYDHRLIDGADGGRFLQALKRRLEAFDEAELLGDLRPERPEA